MDWPLAHSVASETGQPVHVVCAVLATLDDAAGCSHVALDRLLCLPDGTVERVVSALAEMGRFADGALVACGKKRGASTERVRRHRANKHGETRYETPCNVSCNVTETVSCNADLPPCIPPLKEKGIRINTPPSPSERPPVGAVHHSDQPDLLTASPAEPAPKPKRAPSSSQRFVPPTVDEVSAYCRERGNAVDAEQWHAHYTANGWRVGKNPMRDWRAAVRTWERNAQHAPHPQTRDGPPMPRTYRECQDAERRQTAEDWLRRRGLMDDGEQAGDLGRAPGAATALRVIDADFRTQG